MRPVGGVFVALALLRPAQLVGEPQLGLDLGCAVQHRADGEEIGRRRDVVHPQHVRARLDPVPDRGQRAGEPVTRGAAGDRADEVLARDGQQQRPPELVQVAGARAAPRPSGPASWRSPGRGRASAARSRPRGRSRARSARRGKPRTSATIRPSKDGSSSFCLGAARVCINTSPAPVCAHTSASSGIPQAADVVDDARAGGDRRARHGGLVGVDRDAGAELAGDPLDQLARPARSPRRAPPRGGW